MRVEHRGQLDNIPHHEVGRRRDAERVGELGKIGRQTRTPYVTNKNTPRAGSREHSQGGTDTAFGPSSMLASQEAFDRGSGYAVSSTSNSCMSISSLHALRLDRLAHLELAELSLVSAFPRETTAAASARAACRASGASRAGLWRAEAPIRF